MAQRKCRICLEYSTGTISVHDHVVAGVSYLDTLKLSNQLKLDGSSNEILHICMPCANIAKTAYNFKEPCEEADYKLELNEEIIAEENAEVMKIEEVNVITFTSNRCKSEDESISNYNDSRLSLSEEDNYIEFLNKIKIEPVDDLGGINIQFSENSASCIKEETNSVSESELESSLEDKHSTSEETYDYNLRSERGIAYKLEKLSCDYCEYVPESTNDHTKHIEAAHADKKTESCNHCDESEALKVHLLSHGASKNYECDICGAKFALKNYLRKHLKRHEQQKRFNCSECGNSFKLLDTLKRHIESKTCEAYKNLRHQLARTAFVCKICGKKFTRAVSLHHHNKAFHNINETPCYFCDFLPKSLNELKNHIEQQHADKKSWVCEECGKTFLELRFLKNHLLIHRGNKKHICNICGHKDYSKYNMVVHMRKHTGEKPYSCSECDRKFSHLNNVRRHMATHKSNNSDENKSDSAKENPSKSFAEETGGTYVCKVCNKEFAHHYSLRKHTKDNILEISCYYCEYIPTSSIDSARHTKREHADRRNIACNQCDKMFFSAEILNAHLRRRHSVKYYECKICNYKCTTKSTLIRHKSKHTDESAVQCSDCGKSFKRKHNLTIHLTNHRCKDFIKNVDEANPKNTKKAIVKQTASGASRIYDCKVCDKTFTQRSNLRRHNRNIHNINEMLCFFCDYVPASRSDLRKHSEKEHADKRTINCEHCDKAFFEISDLQCHLTVHNTI